MIALSPDRHTGNPMPYSLRLVCGFFNVPQGYETEPTVYRPFPRRLESLANLQRQHFLLSYLKTLSVGPTGVWTRDLPHGSPMLNQLSEPVGGS